MPHEFSISELAAELGAARATVAKRLAAGNAQASGTKKGAPTYPLREVLRCLGTTSESNFDADRLKPFERRAHWQAEIAKLDFETRCGNLMRRGDVAEVLGRIAGPLSRELDTVADRLERDLRVSGDVVDYVRDVILAARESMVGVIDSVCNRAEARKEPTPTA